jgi:uncharacterized protein YjbI with pentapeptide repeats
MPTICVYSWYVTSMWGYMIIKTILGSEIFKSNSISFKRTVEEAVKVGVNLSHADFRGQKFYNAKLDGILAPGACFWGADCRYIDMSGADLRNADLRNVNFKEACIAGSNLSDANLSGSYFTGAILHEANLEGTIFSCPSIFTCDLQNAANLNRSIYCHRGEHNVPLHKPPIVVNGLSHRMVLFQDAVLHGHELFTLPNARKTFVKEFQVMRSTIKRSV